MMMRLKRIVVSEITTNTHDENVLKFSKYSAGALASKKKLVQRIQKS